MQKLSPQGTKDRGQVTGDREQKGEGVSGKKQLATSYGNIRTSYQLPATTNTKAFTTEDTEDTKERGQVAGDPGLPCLWHSGSWVQSPIFLASASLAGKVYRRRFVATRLAATLLADGAPCFAIRACPALVFKRDCSYISIHFSLEIAEISLPIASSGKSSGDSK